MEWQSQVKDIAFLEIYSTEFRKITDLRDLEHLIYRGQACMCTRTIITELLCTGDEDKGHEEEVDVAEHQRDAIVDHFTNLGGSLNPEVIPRLRVTIRWFINEVNMREHMFIHPGVTCSLRQN